MKKFFILLLLAILGCSAGFSQNIGINATGTAPDASAMLDVQSTTKGLLAPKMTLLQRNAISNPATGLLIYQTDGTAGFYYNSGTTAIPVWTTLTTPPSGNSWALTGNSSTNPATNFIGTTDNQPLRLRVNNKWAGELNELTKNYFIGDSAGVFTTSGLKNTSLGSYSLYRNTIGNANTAMGSEALYSNTAGLYNTALGSQALYSNNAEGNTANGYQALYSNNLGTYNVANGVQALFSNTSGSNNTANGFKALFSNSSGSNNAANGFQALFSNSSGSSNTANGYQALYNNTTGYNNTANGSYSLNANTSGINNTAYGAQALYFNTTGIGNIANGTGALYNNTTASVNVAIGSFSLFTQSFSNGGVAWNSNNVAVGYNALYSNNPTANFNGSNNTAIGTSALYNNTFGTANTATGMNALYNNQTGYYNTAIGKDALINNTGGYYNTATGYQALFNNNGNYNTANGFQALYNNTTGVENVAIGDVALYYNTGGSFNIALGYNSGINQATPNIFNTIGIGNNNILCAASNETLIGNTSMTFIGGQTPWFTYASDKRVKNNIKEDVKGLDFILRLHPVTYNLDIKMMAKITGNKETKDYPGKYDVEKINQSGFLAQEVEVAANESGYNFSGVKIPKNSTTLYSLSYETFVVPLVKAMQEQQQIIDGQQKQIDDLKNQNKKILAAIDQLIQSKNN